MKTAQTTPHAVHSNVSPKVIIWDIDGTLVNTAPPFIEALVDIKIITSLNPDTDSQALCDPVIQIKLQEEFDLNSEQARRMIEEFRQNYEGSTSCLSNLYPGIKQVMEDIKSMDIQQAVVTNKRQDLALWVCENYAIDRFCDPIIGVDPTNKKKKVYLVEECLEHFHTRDAIMIGDTDSDKQAAEEVGVRFIGVNYGYGFRNVPGYANSTKEILDRIKAIGTIPQKNHEL